MYRSVLALIVAVVASVAAALSPAAEPFASCNRKAPSAGAQCGVRGHPKYEGHFFYDVDYPEPQRVSSLKECAYLCERRKGYCRSFFFDTEAKLCVVRKEYVGKSPIKRDPKSTTVFYDNVCFDCGIPSCVEPYGRQLLDNGDFEGQLLGPWYSVNGRIGPGLHSRQSYLCSNRTRCYLGQDFNLCHYETYAYRFDYKLLEPGRVSLEFGYPAPFGPGQTDDGYSTSIKSNLPTPWRTVAGFLNPNFSDGAFGGPIAYAFHGGAHVLIDNVKVSRFPTDIAPKPDAVSIIENGGFETGAIEPWETTGSFFKVVSPGLDSQYALNYTDPEPGFQRYAVLKQNLTTTPNVTYRVTLELQLKGTSGIFGDIGTGPASDYTFQSIPLVRRGRHSVSFLLASPYDTLLLRIRFAAADLAISQVLIDNISMKEVSRDFP